MVGTDEYLPGRISFPSNQSGAVVSFNSFRLFLHTFCTQPVAPCEVYLGSSVKITYPASKVIKNAPGLNSILVGPYTHV